MMKKSIVIFGITFVLLAVVLSGCNEQSSDKEIEGTFIGTWARDYPSMASGINETWTFYANKTVKIVNEHDGELFTNIYNWEDKDGELCIIPPSNPGDSRCGSYEFTNSDTSFTWTIKDQFIMTFNKV